MSYFTNLFSNNTSCVYTANNTNKQLITADYSFDLSDTIGGRPVFVSRRYEEDIPKILMDKSTTSKAYRTFDATCKTPLWNKSCI